MTMAGQPTGVAPPPVIAIDGPAASGKGSAAKAVAAKLGYHCLDSGSLYRAAALCSMRAGLSPDDRPGLPSLLAGLDEKGWSRLLADPELRDESVSGRASVVSAFPAVRALLLQRQRSARRPPGLVAEGRDMGSVVFPDALLKVYLTADVRARARRRRAELGRKGKNARIRDILADLRKRDRRDSSRDEAPLMYASGAQKLDNTDLDAEETADLICRWFGDLLAAPDGRGADADGDCEQDAGDQPQHGN